MMKKFDLSALNELIITDIASTGYAYAQRCQSICLAMIMAEQGIDTPITLIVLGPDAGVIEYNLEKFGLSDRVDVIGVGMSQDNDEMAGRLRRAAEQRRGCRIDDATVGIIESPQVKDLLLDLADDEQRAKYGLDLRDYGDDGRRMMPPRNVRLTPPVAMQNDMARHLHDLREKRLRSWLIDHHVPDHRPITMLDLMISYWKDTSDMMNPDTVHSDQSKHTEQEKQTAGRRMSVGYDNVAHAIKAVENWCAEQPQPICLNLINGQHTGDTAKKKKQIDKAFANVGVGAEVAFLTDVFGDQPHLRGDTLNRLSFIQALPKSSLSKILDQDVMVKGMHLGQGDTLKHFHVHLNDGLINDPNQSGDNQNTAPLTVVCNSEQLDQGGYWMDLAGPESPLINYSVTDKNPDHIADKIIQTITRMQ
jgi:hypothetical protein